jgi:hypothetical protein
MIVAIKKGSGLSGAVRYVMGEGKRDPETGIIPTLAEGQKSRVEWTSGQNFLFALDSPERVDIARRMMEWQAQNQTSKTRKCELDVLPIALSWALGEAPDRKEMEAAARSVLKALGMETARAVFVAHNDTDHVHLHIVASRINPETGKAFENAYIERTVNTWAKDYELEHGAVHCVARLNAQELAAQWRERPELVLEEITKHQATFSRAELLRTLGKAIAGDENRAEFANQVLARPEIIGLRETADAPVTRYTTRAILAAERAATRDAAALAANAKPCRQRQTRSRPGADSRRLGGPRLPVRRATRRRYPPHRGKRFCDAGGRGRDRQKHYAYHRARGLRAQRLPGYRPRMDERRYAGREA